MADTSNTKEWVKLYNEFNEDSLKDEGWTEFINVNEEDVQVKIWKKLQVITRHLLMVQDGNYFWLLWGCVANVEAEMLAAIMRDYEYRKKFMSYTSCMFFFRHHNYHLVIEAVESKETGNNGYVDTLYWRVKIPLMPFASEREYLFTSTQVVVRRETDVANL